MADTAAFPIPLEVSALGWGVNGVASGNLIDIPGFSLADPSILFGGNGVAGQSSINIPGFSLPSFVLGFGGGGISTVQPAESHGYMFALRVLPMAPDDDAFEITFEDDLFPAFPGDPSMIDVLLPQKPVNKSNRVLFQVGNEDWRYTKDAAATVTEVATPIRFRVDLDYLPTFLGDLAANRLITFRLNLPGYFPFCVDSSDNWVRMLTHSRPKREEGGQTCLLDVTFLFVGTYP